MNFKNFSVTGQLPAKCSPRHLMLSGVDFDADLHLQIEPPNSVKNLEFRDIKYPFTDESISQGNLAYTKPFRVLSDAGIKAARQSLEENMSLLGKSTARATKFVRGLGYASSFHRGLSYSPELLSLLSKFAGEVICPHSMTMNVSHTNIGEIQTGKPVDKWHVDSVDYVLIIILSDLTDMVGGELRVLQQPNDRKGTLFQSLLTNGIPAKAPIETVHYVAAGYGIFMQGSKIFHTVNEVLSARESRISLVNSYMPTRPFTEELTHYNTFADGSDGREIAHVEYARHKAWRIAGQMKYILDEITFPESDDKESIDSSARLISDIMLSAAEELLHAAHLIRGEENDNAGWIEEAVQRLTPLRLSPVPLRMPLSPVPPPRMTSFMHGIAATALTTVAEVEVGVDGTTATLVTDTEEPFSPTPDLNMMTLTDNVI